MAWQTVQRNGRPANKALAAELLQTLFDWQPRRQNAEKEEWTCTGCKCKNFLSRSTCRRCKEARLGKRGPPAANRNQPPPASKEAPPKPASAAASRRPPPEQLSAQTEAHAQALDDAAARLSSDGLTERAEELTKEAAALRKKAGPPPPPGQRLDSLEGFLRRAEARAAKAVEGVATAEAALAEAKRASEAQNQEVDEGRKKLAELRAELAAAPATAAADSVMELPPASAEEFAQLREQLASISAERDKLLAEAGTVPDSAAELPADGPSLKEEVLSAQRVLSEAEQSGDAEAYEQAAARHARAATALARAMRLRHRA